MLRSKKVVIMAKPKLIGAVVNVPVDINETFDKLPNCDHIVLTKLKKKLMYKGHVFFEPVNPEKVCITLALLKQSNHFYSDIKIEINSIPFSFCCFNENNEIVDNTHKDKKVIDFSVEVEDSDHNENENRNPLHEHRYIENETLIVNNDIIHEIALGKGHTVSSILDKKREYLSFPDILSKGRFGYHYPRNINIHMSRYFNQRLLNYTQRFSSNSNYIFYEQSVLQQINFHNQISIAMRKMSSEGLNVLPFRNHK